ncbi:triacylglycerol lipase 1-like isoform X2 [Arachis hypogaea]|uniref:triacylglycerol lipase 1-like isoform X2 n=1 Tax=Arachis hypogaea TaxID=3818 RepID=UPI003B21EF42
MEEFRAASQKLGDGMGVKSLMQSTGLGMIANQVVKHEGWEWLYGGLMPSLVGTTASQGTIISFAAFTQMTTSFIQMVLTMGIHQLNFKSEWETNLLVSLCDTRLSCGDMLSSITDESD